jgi:DNA-binding NarL/FixJ family response regulator
MGPLTRTRGNAHRAKRKLYLFCKHPIAQDRFLKLLKRSEFHIVVSCELRLPQPDPDIETSESTAENLAVIDGSDAKTTLEFVRRLHFEHSGLHLLVLLPELEDSVSYPLLRLGVKGLLRYDLASRELARAVTQVASGAYWVPRDLLTHFVESVLPELSGCKSLDSEVEISRREREVLDLLLDNLSNKEIASKLFVTERTIKFHVSNLLSKFHVQRRADLIVLWMQRATAFPWLTRDLGRTLSAHVN